MKRPIALALGSLILLSAASPADAWVRRGYYGGYHGSYGYGWHSHNGGGCWGCWAGVGLGALALGVTGLALAAPYPYYPPQPYYQPPMYYPPPPQQYYAPPPGYYPPPGYPR